MAVYAPFVPTDVHFVSTRALFVDDRGVLVRCRARQFVLRSPNVVSPADVRAWLAYYTDPDLGRGETVLLAEILWGHADWTVEDVVRRRTRPWTWRSVRRSEHVHIPPTPPELQSLNEVLLVLRPRPPTQSQSRSMSRSRSRSRSNKQVAQRRTRRNDHVA